MTSVTKYLNKDITNVIIARVEIDKRNGENEWQEGGKCQVRACTFSTTAKTILFFFLIVIFFFVSFSPFDLLGRLGFSSTLAIAIVLVLIFPIFLLSRLQEEEIISRRLVVANLLLSSFPIIFQTRFVLICSLFPLFFL